MQFPAHGLKFCGARAQVACVILAHAASHLRFHGYFESTSTNNIVQIFSGAKDLYLRRFIFMIVTPCKYSQNNV